MSSLINKAVIKPLRGTAAAFTSANPTLAAGQEGYETDTYKSKKGDGSTAWTSLEYAFQTGLVEDVEANTTAITGKLTGTTDQLCKFWVVYDGTTNTSGKHTIIGSYNVDDVDDNGTGNATINLTNAVADTNGAIAPSASNTVGGLNRGAAAGYATTTTVTVGTFVASSGSAIDCSYVHVIGF